MQRRGQRYIQHSRCLQERGEDRAKLKFWIGLESTMRGFQNLKTLIISEKDGWPRMCKLSDFLRALAHFPAIEKVDVDGETAIHRWKDSEAVLRSLDANMRCSQLPELRIFGPIDDTNDLRILAAIAPSLTSLHVTVRLREMTKDLAALPDLVNSWPL